MCTHNTDRKILPLNKYLDYRYVSTLFINYKTIQDTYVYNIYLCSMILYLWIKYHKDNN